jgi:sugar phosphate isomerase/epimerase
MKDWAQGKFVELGEGTIGLDFPAILAELDGWNYAGWIVIENSRSDISPAHSAQFNADYLKRLGYSLSLPEGARA